MVPPPPRLMFIFSGSMIISHVFYGTVSELLTGENVGYFVTQVVYMSTFEIIDSSRVVNERLETAKPANLLT